MTHRKRDRLIELGASACVAKPLDLQGLQELIHSILSESFRETA